MSDEKRHLTTGDIASIDHLRSAIWLVNLTCKSGIASLTRLEEVLRRMDFPTEPQGEVSKKLRLIARGEAFAFKKPSGSRRDEPSVRQSAWARRASMCYGPETLDWLTTPFWFLIEHVPDASHLIECVTMLPKWFQDELLEPADEVAMRPPELAVVPSAFVYKLTVPFGLSALGALACAWRRARLSGDLGAERWSSVGLAWALQEMEKRVGPRLQPLAAHLTTAFLLEVAQRGYSNGMYAPISSKEVEKFHRERNAFLNWTVDQQLAVGERPSWIERPDT